MPFSAPDLRIACVLFGVLAGSFSTLRADEDPESRWLHAYVLTQTGNELGESELWPLALANYEAALDQFESLAEEFPGFQPRLVAYRSENLKERIAGANDSMNAGDHDLAMLYEEVIETSRIGVTSRCRLDYETAYRFLMRAQWQLSDILRQSPEEIAKALAEQKAYLDELTDASRESLLGLPDGPLRAYHIEKDFAENMSVAMEDLPSFQEIEPTASGMSSALFPDGLVAQVRSGWYR